MSKVTLMLAAAVFFAVTSSSAFAGSEVTKVIWRGAWKTHLTVINVWAAENGGCDIIAYTHVVYKDAGTHVISDEKFFGESSVEMQISNGKKLAFTRHGEAREFICTDGELSLLHTEHPVD